MRRQSKIYDAKHNCNLNVEMPDSSSMPVPQAKLMGGGSSINGGTALGEYTNRLRRVGGNGK